MKDLFIDHEEAPRSGNEFLTKAEAYRSLDEIVGRLIEGHRPLLTRYQSLLETARSSRSSTLVSARDRQTLPKTCREMLVELFDDVERSAQSGVCELTRFFPNGLKSRDIHQKSSVADRRDAVSRCLAGLKQYPGVRDAASWIGRLEELLTKLDAQNEAVAGNDGAKQTD